MRLDQSQRITTDIAVASLDAGKWGEDGCDIAWDDVFFRGGDVRDDWNGCDASSIAIGIRWHVVTSR